MSEQVGRSDPAVVAALAGIEMDDESEATVEVEANEPFRPEEVAEQLVEQLTEQESSFMSNYDRAQQLANELLYEPTNRAEAAALAQAFATLALVDYLKQSRAGMGMVVNTYQTKAPPTTGQP